MTLSVMPQVEINTYVLCKALAHDALADIAATAHVFNAMLGDLHLTEHTAVQLTAIFKGDKVSKMDTVFSPGHASFSPVFPY